MTIDALKESWNHLPFEADHYRFLVENVEDYAIMLLDTSGKVISWNKGAQKVEQYLSEEIIGRHFSVFYTPDGLGKKLHEQELTDAFQMGRFAAETWQLRKDGTVFLASVVVNPIFQNNGELRGYFRIVQDLTEHKQKESALYQAYQELKESEERYRLLIEGVTDYAIFMLDPAGHVATWNEGAKRIKGYEADEIIGRPFSRFYSYEDNKRGYPEYELAEARRLGRFEDMGWRIRKDGSAFWANVVITAIHNHEGKLIGFSKITRDLTDRKMLEEQLYRANEELKETEERSRLLIDSVKDYAILMLNVAGEIVTWNKGAERIKGYHPSEVIGKHFSLFYPRDAVVSGFPQYELNKALEDGRFEDEGWRIRKDGSAFWANVVITPIYNTSGRHIGFSKITRDLTEIRRNEELMQKNQELLRINRELDNFVYTASHDLKSPIANLEGLLSELKEEMGPEREKYNVLMPWIDDALLNLKKIVSELADVTQVDQDEQAREMIHLEGLLGEIKDSLRDRIVRLGVNIVGDFSQVPFISYSRKNLRSILFNLVSNAIKYSAPERTPEIKVATRLWPNEQIVELSVADNGLGIPENQKDKIFSMFRRVHTHVEGSGVGLYLVKKILDNHGDWIEVESELGVGSTFRVHIHQNQEALDQEEQAQGLALDKSSAS